MPTSSGRRHKREGGVPHRAPFFPYIIILYGIKMIDNITIILLIIGVTFCLANSMGQRTVWRFLRRRGEVIIAGWQYTAVKLNSDGTVVKKWE